jgi:hypothetical protein
MTRYLLFNKNANVDLYCILFHDTNSLGGHYEPLIYKISFICNFGSYNTYLSLMCKDLQFHWKHIMHDMHTHGLDIETTSTTSCCESMFNTLCYLVAIEFDVQSLRLYIFLSILNALIGGNHNAFHCLHQYLAHNVIQSVPVVGNWKAYLINMSKPYQKGNIEGGTIFFAVDPNLCRNTMKYKNTHKHKDASKIRLYFINNKSLKYAYRQNGNKLARALVSYL